MEDPRHWVGWLAGIMDRIVDDEGPEALRRAMFCFPSGGGCCSLGDQELGARFESFHRCAVECHASECAETPRIIAQMMQLDRKSSKSFYMRALIDDLARAVAGKMRQKMGLQPQYETNQ